VADDRNDEQRRRAPDEPAWHEKTSTLAGASLAALVVLGLLYFLISTVVRQFDEPAPVQQYFLDTSTTGSPRSSYGGATSSTTETITSTSPPVTTDIGAPGETTTSGTDTTTSSSPGISYPPHTRDEDTPRTTRSRPRLNETRTLYPPP
jgi:cytoskeletal protein RodZ